MVSTLLASEQDLPPSVVANYYYDYSSENLETLRSLTSEYTITKEKLKKWDRILQDLLQNYPMPEGGFYRVCAYLYTAQRDAAFLSLDATKSFTGSLDPLIVAILQLFYPFFTPSFSLEEDEYSDFLAQTVFSNFKLRFDEENTDIYKEKRFINIFAWTGLSLEYNKSTLGWTPWVISPISIENDVPPAPKDQTTWQQPLLTQEEPSSSNTLWPKRTMITRNNWLNIANRYLYSHDISLAKTLLTRSILALALYDAIITNTKLHFFYDVNPLYIKNISSFPSLDKATAYTAASVLSYYFPTQRAHWLNLAASVTNQPTS
jgi:hypothetical protein